ncbi:serine/threonine phosphatase [Leptolyngbya sp. AN03gr2]|uniref:serine/threonine phosphatase n=1 Tax=unclassified Leptolyngbya TaxID=2650499 RepID=UPI003D310F94
MKTPRSGTEEVGMLVCPQCQFENPEDHRFCQSCGTSLFEKPCANCGDLVDWSAYKCSNCGTITGTTRSLWMSKPSDALQIDPRYQVLDSSGALWQVLDREPLKPAIIDTPPDSAVPYLELEPYLLQILPLLLNAWQDEDRDILILEDRSHFTILSDFLKTSKSIPLLQILHWFYEMIDIWEALEPYNLCHSLIESRNLRLDEDQLLCLERLIPHQTTAPTLKNLGTIWQNLLAQLSQTQSASLHILIADLRSESVSTLDELRSRLKAIAYDTQTDFTDSEIMSDPQSPEIPSAPISESSPEQVVTVIAEPDHDSDDMPTVVLPMQLFSLEEAGRTDIGRQRDHNEDCFGIDTQIDKVQSPSNRVIQARGLYVLCDGMGGHAGGEVASQMALDTLRTYFRQYWRDMDGGIHPAKLPSADVIRNAIQQANKAIYNVNQEGLRSGSGRMGTTLVMVLIHDTEAAVAHVGDSRLYRYTRKQGLEQVTLDHEVGQREILRGVEPDIAYGRPDAYQLTQALGPRDEYFVNPDVQFFEINEDMVLLLASDGLTDNDLLETYWQSHVDPMLSSQNNLDQSVSNLIDLANQYNGHDNITAIAIRAKVRPNLDQLK